MLSQCLKVLWMPTVSRMARNLSPSQLQSSSIPAVSPGSKARLLLLRNHPLSIDVVQGSVSTIFGLWPLSLSSFNHFHGSNHHSTLVISESIPQSRSSEFPVLSKLTFNATCSRLDSCLCKSVSLLPSHYVVVALPSMYHWTPEDNLRLSALPFITHAFKSKVLSILTVNNFHLSPPLHPDLPLQL